MPMTFNGALSSSQQAPYQRSIEPSALGLFVNLEQRDMERLRRYEQNWRFYLGRQWSFTRDDGSPLVTVNKIFPIINKGVTWLVGNGFSIGIQRAADNEERRVPASLLAPIMPHLRDAWDLANNRMVTLLELGLMAAVTGDCWVLVSPSEVTDAARAANPGITNFIRILVLGSDSVFPVWDPLNTERMIAVKIVTLFVDDTDGMTSSEAHTHGPVNTRRFTQIFTADKIVEIRDGQAPEEKPNPLGEIPIVHIKNMGVTREYYGLSDIDVGLVDLQKELNEKATDVSDTINYHAQPITVITGAKVKNLERGPNKVWSGFPTGARVTNLEMSSNMGPALTYIEKVERWILEGADLPETALGKAPPMSNTSGVALNMANRPIIDRIKRKRPYFEQGLMDINYFVLRWKQELEGLRLPQGFCRNCGGRIVDVAVRNQDGSFASDRRGRTITKPQCYHADPWTGEFTRPDEMKTTFVKQFSFGSEIQEQERWKQVARTLNQRTSFWDPVADLLKPGGKVTTQEEAQRQAEEAQRLHEAGEQPSRAKQLEDALLALVASVQLPEGSLQVPEEPDLVTIVVELFDQDTGRSLTGSDGTPQTMQQEVFIVPTGCSQPERFDPLRVPCTLNDALPMDKHLDALLAVQLVAARIWSRRHAMEQLRVPDPEKMLREVESDNPVPKGVPNVAGGVPGEDIPGRAVPPAKEIPRTPMQGSEQARASMNQGDPNVPAPSSAGPDIGKNQGGSR